MSSRAKPKDLDACSKNCIETRFLHIGRNDEAITSSGGC